MRKSNTAIADKDRKEGEKFDDNDGVYMSNYKVREGDYIVTYEWVPLGGDEWGDIGWIDWKIKEIGRKKINMGSTTQNSQSTQRKYDSESDSSEEVYYKNKSNNKRAESEKYEKDARLKHNEAVSCYEEEQYSNAITKFEQSIAYSKKAISLQSNNRDAKKLNKMAIKGKSQCLYCQGESLFNEAVDIYAQANTQAEYDRAINKANQAVGKSYEALQVNPNNKRAEKLKREATRLIEKANENIKLSSQYKEMVDLFTSKQYEQAINKCNQIINLDYEPNAKQNIKTILNRSTTCQNIIESNYNKALTLVRSGQNDQALKICDDIIKEFNGNSKINAFNALKTSIAREIAEARATAAARRATETRAAAPVVRRTASRQENGLTQVINANAILGEEAATREAAAEARRAEARRATEARAAAVAREIAEARATAARQVEARQAAKEARKVEAARKAASESQILFNKGWEAEDNDSPDAATKYFKGSQIKAKQACIMFPNNMHYKQILNISTLKIEGNMVFNQGMSLQREANTLQNAGLYQQAIDKYTNSEQKFRGGLEFDQRFNFCVNFVVGCIEECQGYINHNPNLINRISVENVNPENSNDQNISSTNRVRPQRLQYQ